MNNNLNNYSGIFTALITPFKNNHIDYEAFDRLIIRQIEAGIDGIVVCGTSGESATLDFDEKIQLIKKTVEISKNKTKVIAGTGNNNTKETILLSKKAQEVGADCLIIVTPYYNRPSQEGLYQHYKAIDSAVDIPIVLYTVPKRTAVDFSDETIIRLSQLKNIVGIKNSTDDTVRPARLKEKLDKNFYQLCGDDANILSFSANGGDGLISVAANIIPKLCVSLYRLVTNHQQELALSLYHKLLPLFEALYCETNPTPTKYAASLLAICDKEVRLPLVVPQPSSRNVIEKALRELSIIENKIFESSNSDREFMFL